MNRIRPRSFGFAIRSIPRDVAYRLGLLGLDWHCATRDLVFGLDRTRSPALWLTALSSSCRTSPGDGHNRVNSTPRDDPPPQTGCGDAAPGPGVAASAVAAVPCVGYPPNRSGKRLSQRMEARTEEVKHVCHNAGPHRCSGARQPWL